jgi:membrane protease YdiL (CAAX protease family)
MKQQISPTQKTLNVWAVIMIIWSVYRAYFKTDLPIWFDEFVAKPIVFILPLYVYISRFENKKFFSEFNLKLNKPWQNLIFSIVVGSVFFVTGILGQSVLHKTVSLWKIVSVDGLLLILTSFATSISEETLMRGFVLKRLYQESKNMYSSAFLTSILFFFIHIPILFTSTKIMGFTLVQVMITDIILSIAVSFIYLDRKSLIVPIVIHAFYNISLYLLM